jgi:hypothetical protein
MKDSDADKKPKSFMEKHASLFFGIPYIGLLILGITFCSPIYVSKILIRISGYVMVGFWIILTLYLLKKSTRTKPEEK